MICNVENCDRQIYCKKMCNKHWARLRRTGTLELKQIQRDDVARFWSKVYKTETCWLWLGSINQEGYGSFGVNYKTKLAHRYSYELAGNKLTSAMQLDHVVSKGCTHRHCVNPAHLEPTTQRENVVRGRVHLEKISKLPVGVYLSGKKYAVRKSFYGKEYHLGTFNDLNEAVSAYNIAREEQYA